MRMFCNNRECKEARMYETLKHIDEFILLSQQIKQAIKDQQEQIQLDLIDLLDYGKNDPVLSEVCQIIADRFQILLDTLEKQNDSKPI